METLEAGRHGPRRPPPRLGRIPAHADVEFMSWTVTEETGKAAIEKMIADFDGDGGAAGLRLGRDEQELRPARPLEHPARHGPERRTACCRPSPISTASLDLNEVFGRDRLLEMFDADYLAAGEVDGKQVALPWIVGHHRHGRQPGGAGCGRRRRAPDHDGGVSRRAREVRDNGAELGALRHGDEEQLDPARLPDLGSGPSAAIPDRRRQAARVNTPEAVAALEFMAGLMEERLAAPEIDRPDARRLFGQGATAFYIDAPQRAELRAPILGPRCRDRRGGRADAASGAGGRRHARLDPVGPCPRRLRRRQCQLRQRGGPVPDAPDDRRRDWCPTPWTVGPARYETGATSAEVDRGSSTSPTGPPPRSPTAQHDRVASRTASEVATIIGEEVQAAILGQKTAQEAADAMQSRLDGSLRHAEAGPSAARHPLPAAARSRHDEPSTPIDGPASPARRLAPCPSRRRSRRASGRFGRPAPRAGR